MRLYHSIIILFLMTGYVYGQGEHTGLIIGEVITNSSDPEDYAMEISSRGVIEAKKQNFVRAISTGAVTIPANTDTRMSFSSVRVDRGNLLNRRLPTRVKIDKPGLYYVSCNIRWESNANGIRYVWIRKNDLTVAGSRISAAGNGPTVQNVSTVVRAVQDDVFSCFVRKSGAGELDVLANDQETNFTILKVW